MTEENAPRLKGSFIAPATGHMPTVFSLMLWWAVASMSLLVLIPYFVNMNRENEFTDGRMILFWSVFCVISTAHGALAYLVGYRRGGSAWNFFIGAAPLIVIAGLSHAGLAPDGAPRFWTAVLLTPLGLVAVWLLTRNKPQAWPQRPTGFVKSLDRLAFKMGNIWWGIGQIALFLTATFFGTSVESVVGSDKGNEAAYANIYNAWWFGILFVVFFATLYCATMRKYPFRISQAGWLTTHAGLLVLVVGLAMMYWGDYKGTMTIFEGETSSHAYDERDRQLHVKIPTLGYDEKHDIEIDKNPEISEVEQVITVKGESGGRQQTFRFTIDKYYSRASHYERVVPHVHTGDEPDAHRARAGAQIRIDAPGGFTRETYLLEGSDQNSFQLGSLSMYIQTAGSDYQLAALTHRFAPGDSTRGAIRVVDGSGDVKRSLIVQPIAPGGDASRGRGVVQPSHVLADRGLEVSIDRYFDRIDARGQGFADLAPGVPAQPAVEVTVNGAAGSARYLLFGDGQRLALDKKDALETFGVDFRYECPGSILLPPSSMLIAIGPDDRPWMFIAGKDGRSRREPLEIDRGYSFSEEAPIRVTPLAVYASADYDSGVEQVGARNTFRAIHVVGSHDDHHESRWMVDRSTVPTRIRLGQHTVELSYSPRKKTFPFSISVLDFRQVNHTNSTKPMKFETNIVLRDPENGVEEALLIDMNHPLTYGGYRFFNSSPIDDVRMSPRRGVGLQVGRNPGYGTIIVGAIITVLGIIVVFFFKSSLRRMEHRRAVARSAPSPDGRTAGKPKLSPQGA